MDEGQARELLGFLHLDTRPDIKGQATGYILGLTGSVEGRMLLAGRPDFLEALLLLTGDRSLAVVKDSYHSLINLSVAAATHGGPGQGAASAAASPAGPGLRLRRPGLHPPLQPVPGGGHLPPGFPGRAGGGAGAGPGPGGVLHRRLQQEGSPALPGPPALQSESAAGDPGVPAGQIQVRGAAAAALHAVRGLRHPPRGGDWDAQELLLRVQIP
ncbi:unnamed protein product [Lepidochelys kempii]